MQTERGAEGGDRLGGALLLEFRRDVGEALPSTPTASWSPCALCPLPSAGSGPGHHSKMPTAWLDSRLGDSSLI